MKHIRPLFHFIKPYWKPALLSLALLTCLVFLDLSIPRLIQRIIDQGIAAGEMSVVLGTSALMLGISLTSATFAVLNNIFSIRAGEGVARDIRESLFLAIQDFSYGDYDRFSTGKLMVRLSSDTTAIQRLVQVTLRIGTRAPLLMIGSIFMMVATDSRLALTLSPIILATTVVIVFFITRMEPLFRSVQMRLDRLNTVLQENIAGAHLVKAFVRDDFENKRFEDANEDFTLRTIRVMRFMSGMGPVLTLFVNFGLVLVIWSGGLQSIDGRLTLGQIVAFTNYLLTTMGPLTMMTMLSQTWASGFASAQRVNEVLTVIPEVQDAPDARRLPVVVKGRLAFEGVSFRYNSATDFAVLEDVTLTAEPGQTVAILGATGAGKTSLINLIPRFYDPAAGRVTLDGIDLRNLDQESLRAVIGIVPQEAILFSGTVRDNIRYGAPAATDEEVESVAHLAQAHDFIMKLEHGYDTHIEERGVNLSGGQKQRLAIARSLLMRPKMLILDDSTSSVDIDTEIRIQSALANLKPPPTTFVVAQRISTVLNADKIVVLDQGRIAAQGTHSELMRSSPIYREIYDSQLGHGLHQQELA